ncbi:acyltransferase 3 [Alteromonas mediterranea MED64]|uniref:acyltransferase family protein n=1 Tax=Alteromonas mediterranea TaxID=314275 RepID=UPI0003556C66|nr:acyltransferase family protein [Alteromonas mediterranea]AGP81544.1 acyltransferase 3 [Alteromonas mediterranea MED64]MBR9783470.1 acyltransferase [Gammaproteobacteria bacterium]
MSISYRAEIDGLRTIAVLSVVIFHLGGTPLIGGFTGVDIFFVISGYLITSNIVKEKNNQAFSFASFYEKRIRRLFPALFATVAVSTVLAYFLFMPSELRDYGQSMAAAVTYLSNVFFYISSDYFEGPSELKPLLHTWSLAVEEQFYILYPILLVYLLNKSEKQAKLIIFALALVFFVATLIGMEFDRSAMFYLSPFRFWELLIGAWLAFLLIETEGPENKLAEVLVLGGLFSILYSVFFIDESVPFPGASALPAVIGASLIIYAGNSSKLALNLLSNSPMVWFGKISYSLYLWHWPVVVFFGYYIIRPVSMGEKVGLFILTVLVSWLSWKYIEAPFRSSKNKPFKIKAAPFVSTALATCVAVCLGLFFYLSKGLPTRFDSELLTELSIENKDKNKTNPCFLGQGDYYHNWVGENCLSKIDNAQKNLLLWGDSHALHLFDGLIHIQEKLDMNILVYASAGCSPMLDIPIPNNPQCQENNFQVKRIINEYDIDTVLMAGNWAWAYKVKDDEIDLSPVKATVKTLENLGAEVHVVNQLPLYSISNPQFLAMRLAKANYSEPNFMFAPYYGTAAAKQLRRLLKDESLIDAYSLMCPNNNLCSIYKNHSLMVVDNGHLSTAGSIQVAEQLLDHLSNSAQKRFE